MASKRHSWKKLLGLAVVSMVAVRLGALARQGVSPTNVQFAPSSDAFRDLFTRGGAPDAHLISATRSGLRADTFFILSYVLSLALWAWHTGRQRYLGSKSWVIAATVTACIAGVLDLLENEATHNALDAVTTKAPTIDVIAINHFATSKWFALGAVGVYFWLRALQTPRRLQNRSEIGHWFSDVEVAASEAAKVAAEEAKKQGKPAPAAPIGIACSGGGIRSACFSLGALQVLREKGILAKATHVTAVSGGGYMAAGWAIAASKSPTGSAATVFAQGSPEEKWLRRHSALIPNIPMALNAVARVVTGIAVNAFLMWLVLFMVARPAGWAVQEFHPELRSRQPYIVITKQPQVAPDPTQAQGVPLLDIAGAQACACPQPAWSVTPVLKPTQVSYWTDGQSTRKTVDDLALDITPARVRIVNNKLVVIRPPHVVVSKRANGFTQVPHPRGDSADPDIAALSVSKQMSLSVVDASPPRGAPLATQFRVTPPRLEQQSGTTGRKPLSVTGGQWTAVGVAFGILLLAQLLQMSFRPVTDRWRGRADAAMWFAGIGALGVTAVLVVLPWFVYAIPPLVAGFVSHLPGPNPAPSGSSAATLTLAASGAGVVTIASVVRLLRGGATALAKKRPMTVAKVAIFVVLLVIAFVVFIGQVQMAAANGPGGHLAAAGTIGVGFIKLASNLSDIDRWLVAGLVLLAWRYALDAQANSLFPFYKHRMSEAFAVHRVSDNYAKDLPYREELKWANCGHFGLDQTTKGPELVLCATVNAYGPGEAASGRRASSFTFSPTRIGGPGVGYVDTAAYHAAMSKARQKDITVPASIAISGAAFSPGMGKMSLGPIDNLLAVANARLGVWLPNPSYVRERIHDEGRPWRDRPGWPQFLREVLGRFRLHTPYVYISDGGHWENLGMIELLRRGCRNVFILSGAGDGATSFSTIGEAIALAREELQLEIEIDLEPMRAEWMKTPPDEPIEEPVPGGLRMGHAGTPAKLAAQGYAIGRIFSLQPEKERTFEGLIVILEANMSSKTDWDVTTWAEGHAIFPDDSTVNQNFNHRQFESYRMRGRRQVEGALAALVSNADAGPFLT